jgi:hypothetical protein
MIEIFTIQENDSSGCIPAGIMSELVESYLYQDSPIKEAGWASHYYYLARYLKPWYVSFEHPLHFSQEINRYFVKSIPHFKDIEIFRGELASN